MTDATDKLAAFKARDAQERIERAELDQSTLPALIARLETAITEVAAVEALCGDLVSDVSHHALKAQTGPGRPSDTLKSILLVAQQSSAALDLFLTAEAAKVEAAKAGA